MYEKGYEMFRVNILSAVLKVQDPQKKLYIHSECSKVIGRGMASTKWQVRNAKINLIFSWPGL